MFLEAVGRNLRDLRDAAGLSQARLACAVGTHLRSVQSWEYGQRTMNIEHAALIARVLRTTIDALTRDAPLTVTEQGGTEPHTTATKKTTKRTNKRS